jgi:hypothetical protein
MLDPTVPPLLGETIVIPLAGAVEFTVSVFL